MKQIVLASSNAGKIREIQAILTSLTIVPQSAFNVVDVEETGLSFVENAILKARHAARYCQLPVIADDSGLIVDALDGAPGVISARYAGIGVSDQDNIEKLLKAMENVPDPQRTARFVCVMVFLRQVSDPYPLITQASWEGQILRHPVGHNGFGYDPVFWLPDQSCSSAELPPELKNVISHRAQALKQLAVFMGSELENNMNRHFIT